MNSFVALILIGLAFMLGLVMDNRDRKEAFENGYIEGKEFVYGQAVYNEKATWVGDSQWEWND